MNQVLADLDRIQDFVQMYTGKRNRPFSDIKHIERLLNFKDHMFLRYVLKTSIC